MSDTLRDIYDAFAYAYETNRGAFDLSEVLDSFYSTLEADKGTLLDLGCGAGEPVAHYFVDKNWSVIGVDFSSRMLELAAKFVPEMKTINADMTEIEFESNRFDAITATYILYHIPASTHAELLRKRYRWLKPNGKVLFTYATKEFTGSEIFDGYKVFMDRELYYSHKTPEGLYSDLKEIGFHIGSSEYLDIGDETFLWVSASKIP